MKSTPNEGTSDRGPFFSPRYNAPELEPQIMTFWEKQDTYAALQKMRSKGKEFYFLDGPPYTSGRVHIGTAWNKSLKDMVLRYKRMQGFNVWDRAGYDMHGLPTEHATEKKLGIKGKKGIQHIGVKKFIDECKTLCVENMKVMNKDFQRLGAWMDFDNAYQTISKEYMEGVWWLVKKAHDKKRLYEGKRAMTWCGHCATAIAKHELEYKNITDTSLFVKFPVKGKENTFLLIWTTTPWTIPFNLAVMVNPELDYLTVEVQDGEEKGQHWILAKALAGPVMNMIAERKYKVVEEYKGEKLEGIQYTHPLEKDIPYLKEIAKDKTAAKKLHTVLMSNEYVTTTAGTGLVHCAPGCGAEDYEVGHRNGLPAFNNINDHAVFENMGKFDKLVAKKDDLQFVEHIEESGFLLGKTKIDHDYPHCDRCHKPVVFKATKQWFFKVEDLKKQMIAENKKIGWVPEAAFNAFNSWLENLRDNSITKQRYWGTAIPVWRCEKEDCEKYDVFGSVAELEKAAKTTVKDMHKPAIDEVTVPCECGGTKKRLPDILDVWVDAGSASWNCLDYPASDKNFKLWPAEFIMEGKDQIRGWFNLLMVGSIIALDKPSFKNCYMHGFVQDALGRKMSKSLGNVISPYEVIDEYGADTFRYYSIGGCPPATDLKYNFEDMKLKHKNLMVLWNLHKYVLDISRTMGVLPSDIDEKTMAKSVEEKYMLSYLNNTLKKLTQAHDTYALNEIPWLVEGLFLELSRTYIQLIREKTVLGTNEEKQAVLFVLSKTMLETLKLFAPVAPFISEAMYQNMRHEFGEKWSQPDSIHHCDWPKVETKLIDDTCEEQVTTTKNVMQAILHSREKAQLGLRWPVKSVTVSATDKKVRDALEALQDIVKNHTNIKELIVVEKLEGASASVKGDYDKIQPDFEDKSAEIIAQLSIDSPETILGHIDKEGKHIIKIKGDEFAITKKHLIIEREAPPHFVISDCKEGVVYLDKTRTDELDAEGFARELMRRIQSLRKKAGLEKRDSVTMFIQTRGDMAERVGVWKKHIAEKVGATQLNISSNEPANKHEHHSLEKIKGEQFDVFFDVV